MASAHEYKRLSREDTSSREDSRAKVCFLIDNLSVAGTEKHLLGLINGLDRKKVKPILVLLDGELDSSRQLEPDNCEVHRLGLKLFWRPSIISKAFRFIRLLQKNQVDVLQMYFPDSTLFGSICGKLAGVRALIRTRRNTGYWMKWSHRWRARLISALVHKTIVNNDACRQSVIEQEYAIEKTIELIPNGIDLTRYTYRQPDFGARKSKKIGMLGNLRDVKRVNDFIQAAARLTQKNSAYTFEVAGDGPLRDELQSQIDRLDLGSRVQLLGTVNDIPKYLSGLDILVSCSETEGLSNAILESMASGVPVVATDIEGNRNLIQEGENGLFFPVGDIDALVNKIEELVADDSLAKALSLCGRQNVEEKYEQGNALRKYESIFSSYKK